MQQIAESLQSLSEKTEIFHPSSRLPVAAVFAGKPPLLTFCLPMNGCRWQTF